MNRQSSLTDPDPAALERSRRLARLIEETIAAAPGGAIGFDRYMELALYTPELGYYSSDNAIFGADGDFITAPESGSLFARCVAEHCAQVLHHSGDSAVIEYGAGNASLALEVFARLVQARPGQTLEYHIVEPSAHLRERQQQRIKARRPDLYAHMFWHADHPAESLAGVVIANEVLDAMPARRYRVEGSAVQEIGVTMDSDGFAWRPLAGATVPAELSATIASYADGYCCEANPNFAPWLADLRGWLRRGVVLLCDYGYPRHEYLHPERSSGTLKCHYRHQVHDDPFVFPGLQDLTTAVNFSDLAEAAVDAGLAVAGFTTQAHFLLDCGLERIMVAAMSGATDADYRLAQEAKRLLLPGEMGETCKFMALAVDYEAALPGFARDQRQRLAGFV